eukprot:1331593-Amorphochlora_amoeboformis.AAC.1
MAFTTTNEESREAERLLGEELTSHPRVALMTCNSVNDTQVKKKLKQIALAEGVGLPTSLCKEIVNASNGDLRNAILSLQVASASLEGGMAAAGATTSLKGTTSRKRKKRSKRKKPAPKNVTLDPSMGGRDGSYSMFRALGKILYMKEGVHPEDVVEASGLSAETFLQFLQHNCLDHLTPSIPDDDEKDLEDELVELEPACEALINFSTADLLDAGKQLNYGNLVLPVDMPYSASFAGRGYIDAKSRFLKFEETKNRPVKRKFLAVRGAPNAARQRWISMEKVDDIRRTLGDATGHLSTTAILLDLLPFLARIGPSAGDFNMSQICLVRSMTSYQGLNRPTPYWGAGKTMIGMDSESKAALEEDDLEEFSD